MFAMKSASAFHVLLILTLISCGKYEKADPPNKSLQEKVSLSRSPDGTQLIVNSVFKEVDYFLLEDSLSWDDRIGLKDSVLYLTPSDQPTLLLAAGVEDTLFIQERHINVKGVNNLRDLGGLFTKEGYQLKWGMIYRSDKLSNITEEDFSRLFSLNLHSIVDLRTTWEAEDEPDQWPELEKIQHIHIPVGEGTIKREEIMAHLQKPDFDAVALMREANRSFVEEYTDEYRQFFSLLLEEQNYPILYHCSAGKDRTGFASAIILAALGVDRKTIMDEYLLSNYYLFDSSEERLQQAALFYGIDHQLLRQLMEVKSTYLEEAFQAIEEKYGTVDQYLQEGLKLESEELEQLRQIMLYDYPADNVEPS